MVGVEDEYSGASTVRNDRRLPMGVVGVMRDERAGVAVRRVVGNFFLFSVSNRGDGSTSYYFLQPRRS